MENKEWTPNTYNVPEVVEVGEADELTLGGCSCTADDSCTCKRS
jgi:hypothetical protein